MRTSDPAASTTMSTGAQQRQRFFAGADRGDLDVGVDARMRRGIVS
jgi:hypothetical protein